MTPQGCVSASSVDRGAGPGWHRQAEGARTIQAVEELCSLVLKSLADSTSPVGPCSPS